MSLAAVVLAAGEGRRFGGVKQIAAVAGVPVLRRAVDAVAGRPGIDDVFVVLGAHETAIRDGVALGDVTVVRCAAWRRGPTASLAAGLSAAVRAGADAAIVTLGDHPFLAPTAIERVLAAEGPAVRAVHGARPGHPVLLRGPALQDVLRLEDDDARRRYLAAHAARVDVADVDDGLDVDRPEDLGRMRERVRRPRACGPPRTGRPAGRGAGGRR